MSSNEVVKRWCRREHLMVDWAYYIHRWHATSHQFFNSMFPLYLILLHLGFQLVHSFSLLLDSALKHCHHFVLLSTCLWKSLLLDLNILFNCLCLILVTFFYFDRSYFFLMINIWFGSLSIVLLFLIFMYSWF